VDDAVETRFGLVEVQRVPVLGGDVLGEGRRRQPREEEVDGDDLADELGVVRKNAAVADVEQALDPAELAADRDPDPAVGLELGRVARVAVAGEELGVERDAVGLLAAQWCFFFFFLTVKRTWAGLSSGIPKAIARTSRMCLPLSRCLSVSGELQLV
jgi:hypothetical protein